MKTPETREKAWTLDLVKLQLGCITGAIDILSSIIREKLIPFPVRFCLGIFEIQDQHGKYISLRWSPLNLSQDPIHILDSETVWREAGKFVLGVVTRSLEFVENNVRARWINQTRTQFQPWTIQGIRSLSLV